MTLEKLREKVMVKVPTIQHWREEAIKEQRKKVSQGQSILLNLRIPRKKDYAKPISDPFFINIIV